MSRSCKDPIKPCQVVFLISLFSVILTYLLKDSVKMTTKRPVLRLQYRSRTTFMVPSRHLLVKDTRTGVEDNKEQWKNHAASKATQVWSVERENSVYVPDLKGAHTTKMKVDPEESWFYRLSDTKVNPYIYRSVLGNKKVCERNSDFEIVVLVAVMSAPKNIPQRVAIRKTWGNFTRTVEVNGIGVSMRTVFLAGMSEDLATNDQLLIEGSEFRDMVIDDFIDSYQNLSIKSLMLLHWVKNHCQTVHYVAKVDDDMFINPQVFLRKVAEQPRFEALFGARLGGNRVIRVGRWGIPRKEFPFSVLPTYLAGNMYVMSTDVAHKLFQASEYFHRIVLEDLYITGVLSVLSGVKPYEVEGFPFWLTTGPRQLCSLLNGHLVAVHDVSPFKITEYWHRLMSDKTNC